MPQTIAPKANMGYFFEDFHVGQVFRHATPRTPIISDTAVSVSPG